MQKKQRVINIRLSHSLYAGLVRIAKEDKRTVSDATRLIIEAAIATRKK
jgi:hypothetical protein